MLLSTCAYEKGGGKSLAFASLPENTNTAKIKTGSNNRATHFPPLLERERETKAVPVYWHLH